jgi:hypothetical protein
MHARGTTRWRFAQAFKCKPKGQQAASKPPASRSKQASSKQARRKERRKEGRGLSHAPVPMASVLHALATHEGKQEGKHQAKQEVSRGLSRTSAAMPRVGTCWPPMKAIS